jgi:hypothetical protein
MLAYIGVYARHTELGTRSRFNINGYQNKVMGSCKSTARGTVA